MNNLLNRVSSKGDATTDSIRIFVYIALSLFFLQSCASTAHYFERNSNISESHKLDNLKVNYLLLNQSIQFKIKNSNENSAINNSTSGMTDSPKVNSFQVVSHIHIGSEISHLFYSPDFQLFIVWEKGIGLKTWDPKTLQIKSYRSDFSKADLVSVARSILVTYSRKDRLFRFYDLDQFKQINSIDVPVESPIYGMALEPSFAKKLAFLTTDEDSEVQIHSLDLDQVIHTLLPNSVGNVWPINVEDPFLGQIRTTQDFRYIYLRTGKTNGQLFELPHPDGNNRRKNLQYSSDAMVTENGLVFSGYSIREQAYGHDVRQSNNPTNLKSSFPIPSQSGNTYMKFHFSGIENLTWVGLKVAVHGQLIDLVRDSVLANLEGSIVIPDQGFRSASKASDIEEKLKSLISYLNLSYNEFEELLIVQAGQMLSFYKLTWEPQASPATRNEIHILSPKPFPLRPGESLDWRIQTLQQHQGLDYEVAVGPEGLLVDTQGVIKWQKPLDAVGTVQVVIRIFNKDGEAYYVFKI